MKNNRRVRRVIKRRRRPTYVTFGWLILFLLLGGSIYWWSWYRKEVLTFQEGERGIVISTPKNVSPSIAETSTEPKTSNPVNLPDSAKVEMNFLVQAPFGKWDALHEDACEETSLIMLKYFKTGGKWSSLESADQEIKDLVAYEEKNGYGLSITLQQLLTISKAYYPDVFKSGKVVENSTVDQIKAELAAGRPVIVGAAGKILPNPHFSNGGPNYHMLVIIGYDKDGFITNDPGVSQGANFRYTFDALQNAIHNWDAGDILNGQKAYLVFE